MNDGYSCDSVLGCVPDGARLIARCGEKDALVGGDILQFRLQDHDVFPFQRSSLVFAFDKYDECGAAKESELYEDVDLIPSPAPFH